MITGIAPAKINLFLRVCGKSGNGYHRLDSVVTFTNFGDKLTVTTDAKTVVQDQLFIDGPFATMLTPEQYTSQ